MALHYKITVAGRVQGVFFRVSTQKESIRLGLTGFVRNEHNGNVYLEVEGEREIIEKLLVWIRLGGPQGGEVNDVEIEEGDFVNFSSFQIH